MSKFLPPTNAKKNNRSLIFHYIYTQRRASKPVIAQALNLSLPTVTQHLGDLFDEHLIIKGDLMESTGGRKAQSYQCNPSYRFAVGVDIWNENLEIVILDLYGQTVREDSFPLSFANTPAYCRQLCSLIRNYIATAAIPSEHILGIGISLQGIVSSHGDQVVYGNAMNTIGITLDSFTSYLPWPCLLIHNVESAAFAESFALTGHALRDVIYLSLNPYFGGTLILGGAPYHSGQIPCGTIEHMCLVLDGLPCYCGKRGCINAYCSVHSLKTSAGEDLETFFANLRRGQSKEETVWRSYLRKLALAIDNIRMVFGNKVILGGQLESYMTDEDILLLEDYVLELSAFKTSHAFILRSLCGKNAAAKGAALKYLTDFLASI